MRSGYIVEDNALYDENGKRKWTLVAGPYIDERGALETVKALVKNASMGPTYYCRIQKVYFGGDDV